ncbi:MAG TPA: hypothetical protein VF045_04485 [Acidimicrobiales bacterium]
MIDVALRQHGVVTRSQVLALGFTDRIVSLRLGAGRWVSVHAGVYRLAAAADTWRSRCMAACLALGPAAVASHRAAGALWGLDGCRELVEVSVPRVGERRLAGVEVHRTRALPVADRADVDGLPVTRPARTLIDLAAVLSAEELEAALDSALRDHVVSPAYLERRLEFLGTRGRSGAKALRDLLRDRTEGRPADSRRENDVVRALVAGGLPSPVRQFPFEGIRFDLAYPDVLIAVEFDSYRHHFGRQSWRRDTARHNQATASGWLVFHLTEDDGVAGVVTAYRVRSAA